MSVKGGGDSRRLRAVVGLCGPPRTVVGLCGPPAHPGRVMRPRRASWSGYAAESRILVR